MSTSANSPRATKVEFTEDAIVVQLNDGRTVSAPLEWFPRLRDASQEDLRACRLIGKGQGIRWEALDEDISVPALLCPKPSKAPPCGAV